MASVNNLPKIINLLNTNLVSKQPLDNNENNSPGKNISMPKLKKLLAENFGQIIGDRKTNPRLSTGLELLGQGLNGTVYAINHAKQDYICKCIEYSKENMEQLEYELDLIKRLQQHEIAVRYINPCLGMAITQEYIVTIFPRFTASTLDKVITTISIPSFNTPQRVSLIKYLIYQMILGLTEIHRQGICHRQINSGSILIEVIPTDPPVGNIGVASTATKRANTNTHKIWETEDNLPLRIKYTNFGFGCLSTCLPMLTNVDPYQPNGPADFTGSQKYDVWCLGLLFMKLLHEPLNDKKLVAPELEKFLDVVQSHMLVPLEARKSASYIKDTIAINDKLYDDLGSDGGNETQNLVEKVLAKII